MVSVCWDLDGTLTDPYEGIAGCIRYGLTAVGCEAGDDDLRWCIGPPLLGSFERLTGCEEKARVALEAYRERFLRVGMFENRVYEGVLECLEGMQGASWGLFVVTSKPRMYAVPILEHFGLLGYFSEVYGSELDGRFTDKRELLAFVVEKEGLDVRQTVMVGDRKHDFEAARFVGCRSVAVTWGYGDEGEWSEADVRVEDVREVFFACCQTLG